MKTKLLLCCLLLAQYVFSQNAATHEQAYGFIGFESGEMQIIEPAFLPGQYLLGGQLNKGAIIVQSNKIGQSLAYRRLSLGTSGESRITDLLKLNNQLFATAGTCTGCADTILRQSIFITIHDGSLNQIATLVLSPTIAQNKFDNARLATNGTQLYLTFNDNFFGGSLNVRAFDFNLQQAWSSFQNLGFVETPLSVDVQNNQLWVCSQEWNGFDNIIGTRLVRFNAETGVLINHYRYPAFVDASTVLPNGNLALASYGGFYTGSQRIKLSIISSSNGAVLDSVLLGTHERSRATALQALPNGQLLMAVNEVGFFDDTLKLLRYNPANLTTPVGSRKIKGEIAAKKRVVHDLLPLSDEGNTYLAVGTRTDVNEHGMFLASFPEVFTPQPPANWNNDVCGSNLLNGLAQSHYPSCLPKVYEKIVYHKDALRYNGQKQDLSLDLYIPFDLHSTNDLAQKRPLLVIVHGGGFLGGDEDSFSQFAIFFAELGYVVASINYRLGVAEGVNGLDDFCGHEKEVFAAIYRGAQDTRRAIQFLYDNANLYHIDRNNILALGHSAGAVNVLNSALLDADELPYNFVSELGPLPPKPPVQGYIPWAGSVASLEMIDKDEDTPMFFIHGTCDPLIPYDTGNLICPDLPFGFGAKAIVGRKKTLCHNYHLLGIQKGDHGMGGSEQEVLTKLIPWLKNESGVCGQGKQTCETIQAATPLNCAESVICPTTQSCLVATREPKPGPEQIHMYPNPALSNGQVNIELDDYMGTQGDLSLYNLQGQALRSATFSAKTIQLDVQGLPPGVYVVKIRTDKAMMKSQLVVQ
ncbi:T9SS type A sorting domain-containing protein [Haliscomenobacter hydrossis]|uniref:Carboxylesterase type B n=1 Tax=Haliscomenobacter hydrossis (strain ATCC 27775 / DSM 1100 / LMG 10767 / O) TaxID=760192 RepID=F4L3J3_HALH1|nr:T9SS type A sorting domain-containing protein [Haliscomenobacter hydrossis]AEE52970.1 Carboxylesterase type B [Haliscomenobacter hydrossis DSM 1100]